MVPGADAPDLARAEREARLAAMLNHPHVVGVFDLVVEDDHQWLVMEYVEGETLGAAHPRRRDPSATTRPRRCMWQAAEALAAAHAARRRAPGREAVQHPGDRRRPGQAHRLRHRPRPGGRQPHPDRPRHRLPRVPRPRGGLRIGRDRGERRLVAGCDPLPLPGGAPAVRRGREPHRRPLQDRARGAPAPDRRRTHGRRPRAHHGPRPRAALDHGPGPRPPRRPAPGRGAHPGRARAGAGADPRPVDPPAATPATPADEHTTTRAGAVAPTPRSARRRRSPLPWLVAAAAALLVGIIVVAVLQDDPEQQPSADPANGASSPSETSSEPTPTETPRRSRPPRRPHVPRRSAR